jgi:predicted CoA-binding protein
MSNPEDIDEIVRSSHRIAVVGLSANPTRPSYDVAAYLQRQGYEIIPVNPTEEGPILGQKVYRDLASVPGEIDIVDVFRRSEAIPPIAEAAVQRGGIKTFWMQLGIRNDEAAQLLRDRGIAVVEDRCLKVEHQNRASR